MVTVGLFGALMLVMMSLMAETSRNSAKVQNEARLSEDLLQFSLAVESYLSNTTRIVQCSCGGTCQINTAPDCVQSAACDLTNLFEFDYEDANDPSVVAGAGCYPGASNPPTDAPDGLVLRGCKRRLRIALTPPSRVTPGNPASSTPGELRMEELDQTGAVVRTIQRLRGVYEFRCGRVPIGNGAISPDQFSFKIRAKTRATNSPFGSPGYDGWHPADDPAFRFLEGTHRELSTHVSFRNLNVPGVHFGKAYSALNCVPDGRARGADVCCSGYSDSGGTCIPMDTCAPRGTAAATAAECCSLTLNAGACL